MLPAVGIGLCSIRLNDTFIQNIFGNNVVLASCAADGEPGPDSCSDNARGCQITLHFWEYSYLCESPTQEKTHKPISLQVAFAGPSTSRECLTIHASIDEDKAC